MSLFLLNLKASKLLLHMYFSRILSYLKEYLLSGTPSANCFRFHVTFELKRSWTYFELINKDKVTSSFVFEYLLNVIEGAQINEKFWKGDMLK